MKISISNPLSPMYVEMILARMAFTIDPIKAIPTLHPRHQNAFTPRSCYGAVAHYLKLHLNKVSGNILLFTGPGSQPDEVSHCCLYDFNGKSIVDTYESQYGGHPVIHGNQGYYDVGPKGPPVEFVDDYKLIKKLTANEFFVNYFV